jgi:hypothetical protein
LARRQIPPLESGIWSVLTRKCRPTAGVIAGVNVQGDSGRTVTQQLLHHHLHVFAVCVYKVAYVHSGTAEISPDHASRVFAGPFGRCDGSLRLDGIGVLFITLIIGF